MSSVLTTAKQAPTKGTALGGVPRLLLGSGDVFTGVRRCPNSSKETGASLSVSIISQ